MDSTKKAQLQAYAQAIAALVYEESDPEQVQTLAGIEEAVREHMLEHVSPEVGAFLLQQVAARQADANATFTASLDN
jgi:hypothetical protein